jgi:hypothetical protein
LYSSSSDESLEDVSKNPFKMNISSSSVIIYEKTLKGKSSMRKESIRILHFFYLKLWLEQKTNKLWAERDRRSSRRQHRGRALGSEGDVEIYVAVLVEVGGMVQRRFLGPG